jgi:hypothetical protein
MLVSCKIRGGVVPRAEIQEENGRFYICNDVVAGSRCNDKLGYAYSYCVGDGSQVALVENSVTDLIVLDTFPIETVREGDIIKFGSCERKVLRRCGEAVFLSCWDNFKKASTNYFSIDELKAAGHSSVSTHPKRDTKVE